MASIDPRKAESITNQANYLMTGLTTVILSVVAGIIDTPERIPLLVILFLVWLGAFGARTAKKAIEVWSAYKEAETALVEKKMELEYQLKRVEVSAQIPKEGA